MSPRFRVALVVAVVVTTAGLTGAVRRLQVPSSSMEPAQHLNQRFFVSSLPWGLAVLGHWLVRWGAPDAGDVVVFVAPPWVPANAGELWTKRVVAVAGQSVAVVDCAFVVDGAAAGPGCDGSDRVVYADHDDARAVDTQEQAAATTETLRRRDGSVVVHRVLHDVPARLQTWPTAGAPPRLPGLRCSDVSCVVEAGYVFVAGDNRDHSADSRMWGGVPVDAVVYRALVDGP